MNDLGLAPIRPSSDLQSISGSEMGTSDRRRSSSLGQTMARTVPPFPFGGGPGPASLGGGPGGLPEDDLAPAGLVQAAVGLPDVRAGGEELAAGAEGVGDLVVGVVRLQRREVEPAGPGVELQHR